LITILDRNAFYEVNNVRQVWLTDAADLSRLSQLAFRDLYLLSGGRMFAIDADVLAACADSTTFQLKELSIAPRIAKGHPWAAFRLIGKAPKFLPRLGWNRLAS